MTLIESLTPEIIGLILAILVPFGIAVYWVAVTRTKLNMQEKEIRDLKNDVKYLTTRVDAHISVMDILRAVLT